MAKNTDIRMIVSNLAKLGIQTNITKSRGEVLKALALPKMPQTRTQV